MLPPPLPHSQPAPQAPFLSTDPCTIVTDIPTIYQHIFPPLFRRLLAQNIINLYPPSCWICIYTDGSVDRNHQVSGAGTVIHSPHHTAQLSLPLGPYSCSMDSEVRAIIAALQHPDVTTSDMDLVLFTDSKSSLLSLRHLLTSSDQR